MVGVLYIYRNDKLAVGSGVQVMLHYSLTLSATPRGVYVYGASILRPMTLGPVSTAYRCYRFD